MISTCYHSTQQKNKVSLRNLSIASRHFDQGTQKYLENVKKSLEYAKEAVAVDVSDGQSWGWWSVLHVLCVLCVLCVLYVLCVLCVLYCVTLLTVCTVCTACTVCTICTVYTVCAVCIVCTVLC